MSLFDVLSYKYNPGQIKEAQKARYAQEQADKIAKATPGLFGELPIESQPAFDQSDLFHEPGEAGYAEEVASLSGNITAPVKGTGMYDPGLTSRQRISELNKRLMASGIPALQKQGLTNIGNMQTSMMQNIGAMEREQAKAKTPSMSTAGKMAAEAGWKPGTPGFTKFINDYAFKSTFEREGNKPLKAAELEKWMSPDKGQPPAGTTANDLKTGGYTLRNTQSAEGAGKAAMLNTSIAQLPIINNNIYTKDAKGKPTNSMNQRVLWEMFALDKTGGLAAFGTSKESQKVYAAFETGIQGITRTETGAAMRDEEIDNTKVRFLPRPWFENDVNNQRYQAFQYFLKNAADLIDPIAKDNKDNLKGMTPEEIVNMAADKAFAKFGVDTSNDVAMAKLGESGAKYTKEDDQYVYGTLPNGQQIREAK